MANKYILSAFLNNAEDFIYVYLIKIKEILRNQCHLKLVWDNVTYNSKILKNDIRGLHHYTYQKLEICHYCKFEI